MKVILHDAANDKLSIEISPSRDGIRLEFDINNDCNYLNFDIQESRILSELLIQYCEMLESIDQ